jgi:molybdenum-dependent DNA-binding transcriptional regulator ModE
MAYLKVSIILDSGARVGPGKAKLLESIRDTGSIPPRPATWACLQAGVAAD